jgi:K+/H+ antiporter YhaU regulatory subunit KhtT
MQNLKVGDIVQIELNNQNEMDKIIHIDSNSIIGERYDLTNQNLKVLANEKDIDEQVAEVMQNAKNKAEELFLKKSIQYPEVYRETIKDAFILFFIEGYIQGYIKKSNN